MDSHNSSSPALNLIFSTLYRFWSLSQIYTCITIMLKIYHQDWPHHSFQVIFYLAACIKKCKNNHIKALFLEPVLDASKLCLTTQAVIPSRTKRVRKPGAKERCWKTVGLELCRVPAPEQMQALGVTPRTRTVGVPLFLTSYTFPIFNLFKLLSLMPPFHIAFPVSLF